jgi:hypothetical protein
MARTSVRRHNDKRVLLRRLSKRRLWAGRDPKIDDCAIIGKLKKYNTFWHCECERCQDDRSHESVYAPHLEDWSDYEILDATERNERERICSLDI